MEDVFLFVTNFHFLQRNHICHPNYWKQRGVNDSYEPVHPRPRPGAPVVISVDDVGEDGLWEPTDPANKEWVARYFAELERISGHGACILVWPEHCLMGSKGMQDILTIQF